MTTNKLKTAGLLFAAAMLFSFFAPRVVEAQTGFDLQWKKNINKQIRFARFAPDGKSIYFVGDTTVEPIVGYDRTVSRVYQVLAESGEEISVSDTNEAFNGFAISARGSFVITTNNRNGATIYDAKTLKTLDVINTFPKRDTSIVRVAISPDDKYIALGCATLYDYNESFGAVLIYDINSKKVIKWINSLQMPKVLAFSHDGKSLAIGGYTQVNSQLGKYFHDRVLLYDVPTWEQKAMLGDTIGDKYGYNKIVFSANDERLGVWRSVANEGRIFDLETGKTLLFPKRRYCGDLAFMPNQNNSVFSYYNYDDNASIDVYNSGEKINTLPYIANILEACDQDGRLFCFGKVTEYDQMYLLKPIETSVKEIEQSSFTLKYYENYLTITSSGIGSQLAKLIINDTAGKEIFAGSVEVKDGNSLVNVNLGTGIFLYRIICETSEFTGKFEVIK